MFTVQHYLKTTNKEELLDEIIRAFMETLLPFVRYKKDSFADACLIYYNKMSSFIDMLTEISPCPTPANIILFAYEIYNGETSVEVDAVKIDSNKINPSKIFPEYDDWNKSVHWLVADTPFTKSNLIYILARYLLWASVSGFTEEEKIAYYEEINKEICESLESDIYIPAEDVFAELEGKYGFTKKDKKTEEYIGKIDFYMECVRNENRIRAIEKIEKLLNK